MVGKEKPNAASSRQAARLRWAVNMEAVSENKEVNDSIIPLHQKI